MSGQLNGEIMIKLLKEFLGNRILWPIGSRRFKSFIQEGYELLDGLYFRGGECSGGLLEPRE